jgi:ubiquinone/menaquinone biosynthesis C-methylase UbiE
MDRSSKREVAKAYDALGGRIYDLRYTQEQESKYSLLLRRVKPEASDVTLDVGCGTGMLLERLNSNNVGLDISPVMLSAARSRIGSRLTNGLVLSDAENLPFKDAMFNKVYSVTLIHNVPHPERAVLEMKRVSRRDSRLAITALKKGLSEAQFTSLFERTGLEPVSFVYEEELKDWVAIADS